MVKKMIRAYAVFFLLQVLFMGVFSTRTQAASPDCSLTVTFYSEGNHKLGIPDVQTELFQVAEVQTFAAGQRYVYTAGFAGNGMALDDPQTEGLGVHLQRYAAENGVKPIKTGKTDAAGQIVFDSLPQGLYLVVQNGRVPGFYQAAPFLVSLPMTGPDGSSLIYDVEAMPKMEPEPENPGKNTGLEVRKIWVNRTPAMPESITVQLIRDGQLADTVQLSDKNGWSHRWEHLDERYHWNVVEKDVPKACTVQYQRQESIVTITNTVCTEPQSLTVTKNWNDSGKQRPNEVTVQLLRDGAAVQTVTLSAQNGWSYTWHDLARGADWDVREVEVPAGYIPVYTREENVISITNTTGLIQTGQLNWPIPILTVGGLLLFLLGWVKTFHGRSKNNEGQ